MKNKLPIVENIPYQSPLQLFKHFVADDFSLLLHSGSDVANMGRYSFIAADPFDTFVCQQGVISSRHRQQQANPWCSLREFLRCYQHEANDALPPFQGGLAGFFSYDAGQYIEKLPAIDAGDFTMPDMMLGLYDVVIAFDHQQKQAMIISQGFPQQDPAQRQQQAVARIAYFKERILQPLAEIASKNPPLDVQAEITAERYLDKIKKAQQYILNGDIFEVNLSQRFSATVPGHYNYYQCFEELCQLSPAPFSAYFKAQDNILISSSPERFMQLQDRKVTAKPIKGTRPRGQTAAQDQAWVDDLCHSEKDKAENVMIVDLMRNDLAKVCDYASIQVNKLCGLESFAQVHHLVSEVEGRLRQGCDPIDLLKATFPGGSITGAPKIRAMEIISELEQPARGPYCGSLGYLGFDGTMDLSILIRTICAKADKLYCQAGGAIVLDSDAQAEYDETLTKAEAMLSVLRQD